MSVVPARSPLSVVIATAEPWPVIKPCLDRIVPQVLAVGGEVIVGDGHERGVSDDLPGVRRVPVPGADVFEIRALVADLVDSDIVVFTEDHCMAESDWCERILAAHEAHPEAALIGGAMRNGSTRRLVDWANFLPVFAPFMPPMTRARGDRVPPPGNISYKRDALPREATAGELIIDIPRRLHIEGKVVMDPTILMSHVQEKGFFGSFVNHFHNGRSTAGLALVGASRDARRRHRRTAIRAAYRLMGRVSGDVLKQPTPLKSRLALPFVGVAILTHTLGEVVGSMRGPGNSPTRIT